MYRFAVLLLATTVAAQYDYSEVIHKSILFYEAQRAGPLPDDNRVDWRDDSVLTDGANETATLSGGWFDAGDHVKFGFPMASTVTLLAWGMLQFEDGYRAAGEWENALDCIKWPLDYFINANEFLSGGNRFFGQVGDGHADHAYWGRPEDLDMERPAWYLYAPDGAGSDLAGETAAAMAASSIVFRESDTSYSEELLIHSRALYDFAYEYRDMYTNTIENARDFYNSFSGYRDELCWGAVWLFIATDEPDYLDKAYEFAESWPGDRFSWDDKIAGCHLLLYRLTGEEQHEWAINSLLTKWFPGGGIPYTPKGLAWVDQWGPNRYSANVAFLSLIAAEYGLHEDVGRDFARSQIHYMLGDAGRSFVVGFGNDPPHSVHHRAASCPDMPEPCDWADYDKPEVNPQILYGALAGGPDMNDDFEDDRTDYIQNEVATDYNSGFQGAVAGLLSLRARGLLV